jgi:hypothetical protein
VPEKLPHARGIPPTFPHRIKIKWKLVLKRFVGTTRSQYQNCKNDSPHFKRLLCAVFCEVIA